MKKGPDLQVVQVGKSETGKAIAGHADQPTEVVVKWISNVKGHPLSPVIFEPHGSITNTLARTAPKITELRLHIIFVISLTSSTSDSTNLLLLKRSNAMNTQFITDDKGKKLAVILPIKEYNKMIDELEEREDVKRYDAAKKGKQDFMVAEEAFKEIEEKRKRK